MPTSGTARILLYPTYETIPATTGYIMYKNVQFREVGTGNNLFAQPSDNSDFTVRGNGNFECNYNDDLTSIYYTYDSSGHLVSMNLNGVEYYYIRNAQGDIIGLFDKSGTQVVSYNYDTWGKLISIDGSLKDSVGVKNPYRYRGYRYDTETGLYYLQSRYYNPEWGRFINVDAIAGRIGDLLSHNIFAYCKNNPVNLSDESGFRPIYTMGEETEEMMEASVTVMATAARNKVLSSKGNIRNPYKSPLIGVSKSINKAAQDNMLNAIKAKDDANVKIYYDVELNLAFYGMGGGAISTIITSDGIAIDDKKFNQYLMDKYRLGRQIQNNLRSFLTREVISGELYLYGNATEAFINHMDRVTLDPNAFEGLTKRGCDY